MDDGQLIARQQASSNYGIVTHERGLELVETSGYIMLGSDFACIYPDAATYVLLQPRVIIPWSRIVSMSLEARDDA